MGIRLPTSLELPALGKGVTLATFHSLDIFSIIQTIG